MVFQRPSLRRPLSTTFTSPLAGEVGGEAAGRGRGQGTTPRTRVAPERSGTSFLASVRMSNHTGQAALFSGLQEGALVLADISGYSTFVAQTEVDHSWSILHELLDTMVRSLAGRMDVSQVEGDAILFISGLSNADVITALEETFVAFHRRLRDMEAVTTCPCSACANVGILKLKFVIHHGKFSRQRLGSVEQLHGTDVIVAHRLLKNKVPSKEYLLVTDAVLERLPADMRSRFTPHTEEFDLGAISGGYEEIAYLWQAAQETERKRVLPEEAMVNSEVLVDAPRELVYKLIHGGSLVSMRVVSLEPGNELTLIADQPTTMHITTRLSDAGAGQTVVSRSFLWEEPADPEVAQGLRPMMAAMVAAGETAIKEVFEENAAAARARTASPE